MSLQVIQDIRDLQVPQNTREELAEKAAKAISFDGDIGALASWLFLVFDQIAKGIRYGQNKFGKVADRFYISEESWPSPLNSDEGYANSVIRYVPELSAIVADDTYLGMMCLGMINNSLHSLVHLACQGRAYSVSTKDLIFLAGIEESHHAYFYKSGGSGEGAESGYRTLEEYRNHPAEKAVAPVIRQAIRELRMQVYTILDGRAIPCDLPDEADYQ